MTGILCTVTWADVVRTCPVMEYLAVHGNPASACKLFYTTFLKYAYNNIKIVLRYNGAEMR